ncbi:tetratricopeptide repeat protein [Massilia glaciei]|uniref:Sel1 repeat family protein n=1 Tax=Massilia glaciei TaxID=1524097 RepID=A0A2U2HIN3_9BURK|nr:tetratricopeptide repeat protein [Massilia glaciei]PWF46621.1 sel1 repeat family protein [Massilia glaciei]
MFRASVLLLLILCAPAQAHDALTSAKLAMRGPSSGWPTAVEQFKRAAMAGNPGAAYYLARMTRNGMGTPRDSVQAAHWFKVAAKGGIAPAMFTLSNMLRAGEGLPRDDAAAREMLEAAAELESPEALQQLALAVEEGALGLARDEKLAAQLMKEAAHALKHRPQEP